VKEIPPGGEGKITVRVSTKGYGGRKISEAVSIYTNDKKQKQLTVTVTGLVEKAAEIIPPRAMLNGPAGKPLVTQIRIIPSNKFPLKIVNTRAREGKFIRYRLEEIKEPGTGKPFYLLTVENIRQNKGNYSDLIYLETENKTAPPIQIYVIGNILEKEQESKQ